MRKSHYIFLGLMAIYTAFFVYDLQPYVEERGFFRSLGNVVGHLVIPTIIYSVYLVIVYIVEKMKKANATLEDES